MKIGSAKRKISETGLPSVMFCTVCLAGTVCAMRTSLSLSRSGTNLSFFDEKGKAPQERCFSSIPEETADENSTKS
jgi:hypothetical protein